MAKFVPFALNMILHYHCTPAPWENTSPVTDEWRQYFLREGLLTGPIQRNDGDDPYLITEKGRHFVFMLCDTPLPVSGWRDPRTGEQIETV